LEKTNSKNALDGDVSGDKQEKPSYRNFYQSRIICPYYSLLSYLISKAMNQRKKLFKEGEISCCAGIEKRFNIVFSVLGARKQYQFSLLSY